MQFRRPFFEPLYHRAAEGAAGDTLAAFYYARAPVDGELIDVDVVPNGAAAANDTNYGTVNLLKADGAGGSPTTLATKTTKTAASGGSGNWVAGVPVRLAISNAYVSKGEVIAISVTKAAAGVQLPAFTIHPHFRCLSEL